MNKKNLLLIISLALLVPMLASSMAEAIPAFSRQIGTECRSCHFQDMHGLNAFGRSFKRNAFRLNEHMQGQLQQQKQREQKAAREEKEDSHCAHC